MPEKKWSQQREGDFVFFHPHWPSGAIGAVSTRYGGVSSRPYDSLNLAFHVQDEEARVWENRERLTQTLGLSSSQWATVNQVHGTKVHWIEKEECHDFARREGIELLDGDGIATEVPSLPLAVFGADCALLLYYDPIDRRIGAVHAGWRGTVAGLPALMVQEFKQRGSLIDNIHVAIGPAIGPCCYPVGPEVVAAFKEKWSFADQLFSPEDKDGTVRLHLLKAIELQLEEVGLLGEQVSSLDLCTSCHDDIFYSYRRAHGQTGRHGALIMLTEER
ncbi:peptidoglycan editing factor PgeF [Heliorestis convoluta]|uniref:Purine nucleoside phosphorylase n=1 Tax=Heliorestis convoluta TaxID=356322 RepID=A0A5Q2N3Q1_9FIRM|nr:peptidoglycan editing factor PgeF [Heliorestis convoluta]QGG47932.1 peptidoglycan editing factor PgeF [Heliorestis convoluta]